MYFPPLASADVSNPDTKLTLNGKTIYKFRIPKGDRTNYSKVIFNDGLSSQSGGNETGVIAYKPGYLYNKDGQETKHYENGPTVSNTAETGADSATEYIYIKMDSTTASTWDDPHITFYDSNGTQILQGGCGYVMDYAGTDSNNTYFKVPIPNDAKKFSVNNGIGTSATGLYDIERLTETSGAPKTDPAAEDRFVYTLTGTTLGNLALTREGYSKTLTKSETTTTVVQNEDTTGYSVRETGDTDDVLALRDKANWNAPINGITVRFYDASGAVIGSGSYNMMVTNADGDGYKWYTKKIPTNAATFDVTYITKSTTNVTPKYPIYPATTADANGNVTTTGDMYYETVGTNTLSVYNAVPSTTEADDETYAKRGDYLYLIYASNQNPVPKVTFKAGNGAVIKSNVTAKYLNEKDNKHWYKVSIPEGAASFEVEGVSGTGNIYELKKTISRYEQNYTIGDMQYEVTDGSLTPKYPIFTQDTQRSGRQI